MTRTRRIGSITLGITLVLCGIVYLLKEFIPAFDVMSVIRLWPVTFIILGFEILIETVLSRKDDVHYKYDYASMFMIMCAGGFAMCMAGAEICIKTGLTIP